MRFHTFQKLFLIRALQAGFLIAPIAAGQSSLTLAGAGYRLPVNRIEAAPGQVLMISVSGITTRFPEPLPQIATVAGWPRSVNGVSVDLVQGGSATQLAIRGIQQSPCPAAGACTPVTSITVEIPLELSSNSGARPVLRIYEAGKPAGEVAITPVTDNAHVINTCDETLIYLSPAYEVPAGVCAPMILHEHGPLVSSAAPAKMGEALVMFVYGLGAAEHPIEQPCCSSPEQLPRVVQPFSLNFYYSDAVRLPEHRVSGVAPLYAGMIGAPLYQVNFIVPNVPGGLPPCSGQPATNLTVQLAGPHSSDTAQICVQ